MGALRYSYSCIPKTRTHTDTRIRGDEDALGRLVGSVELTSPPTAVLAVAVLPLVQSHSHPVIAVPWVIAAPLAAATTGAIAI